MHDFYQQADVDLISRYNVWRKSEGGDNQVYKAHIWV